MKTIIEKRNNFYNITNNEIQLQLYSNIIWNTRMLDRLYQQYLYVVELKLSG